jgi:DNA-binding NtrC family response regulator
MEHDFDVVLLDYLMPELDGLQVLEKVKPHRPATEFVMVTAVDDIDAAVKAIRLGAYDYLVKPVAIERLHLTIEHAFERKGLKAWAAGRTAIAVRGDGPGPFANLITGNQRMKELLSYAEIMARGDTPFLITGESGTGKELLARGVHRASPHAQGPFVPVNMASIPETLFESQFFGHRKGAFTGADRDKPGFFEQAGGGTLFLDEIGELPLDRQARLLRTLEDKTIIRVGDSLPISVDVRIVAATNRDLDEDCRQGRFRLDLLYRLKYAHVHLPPLKERRDDIPIIAGHFLQKAAQKHRKDLKGFSQQAMESLLGRDYPGNIRELAQIVEKAVLMTETPYIETLHLDGKPETISLSERTLCSLKRNYDLHLLFVLGRTRGDRREASRILGVTVRQLQRRIAEMKQDPEWVRYLNDL